MPFSIPCGPVRADDESADLSTPASSVSPAALRLERLRYDEIVLGRREEAVDDYTTIYQDASVASGVRATAAYRAARCFESDGKDLLALKPYRALLRSAADSPLLAWIARERIIELERWTQSSSDSSSSTVPVTSGLSKDSAFGSAPGERRSSSDELAAATRAMSVASGLQLEVLTPELSAIQDARVQILLEKALTSFVELEQHASGAYRELEAARLWIADITRLLSDLNTLGIDAAFVDARDVEISAPGAAVAPSIHSESGHSDIGYSNIGSATTDPTRQEITAREIAARTMSIPAVSAHLLGPEGSDLRRRLLDDFLEAAYSELLRGNVGAAAKRVRIATELDSQDRRVWHLRANWRTLAAPRTRAVIAGRCLEELTTRRVLSAREALRGFVEQVDAAARPDLAVRDLLDATRSISYLPSHVLRDPWVESLVDRIWARWSTCAAAPSVLLALEERRSLGIAGIVAAAREHLELLDDLRGFARPARSLRAWACALSLRTLGTELEQEGLGHEARADIPDASTDASVREALGEAESATRRRRLLGVWFEPCFDASLLSERLDPRKGGDAD
jgi:hypothetical protein